jgi:AmmeMemoRadiSam system protein A
MAEDLPLCQVVGSMALQAAFNDRRFTNVTLKELPEIDIEISVLTPFQPIRGAEDILIGRDGVVLRKNDRSAVFLPQVPVEQGWDRNQLLDRLCQKAGLSAGSWKDGAQLYTFQANVFNESDLK